MTTTRAEAMRAAFLRDICAHPDDDTPRLVYADWLEDEGERDRVEFIRVQLELARREADGRDRSECSWGGTCCCRSHVLRRRKRRLLDAHRLFWAGAIPDIFGRTEWREPTHQLPWSFSRGFVASVSLPLADFLAHAGALFAAHPITEVRLSDRVALEHPNDYGGGFSWYCIFTSPTNQMPYDVPLPIWERLPTPPRPRTPNVSAWAVYATEADALAALSRACVRYGRALANLPPLEEVP